MKINRRLTVMLIVLLAVSGCSNSGGPGAGGDGPLRVAFISHTYIINWHSDIQKMIVDEINAADPDYVFAVGDIAFQNTDHYWNGALEFFSKMNPPVYYAPGNHDLYNFEIVEGLATDRHYPERRKRYIERIGYVRKMVQDDRADFVLMNSLDPFHITQPFLDESLEKADPDTPTVLISHHRIWLERYRDNWIHWYWKSTRKEEMLPYIPKFDQLVIGDLWGKLEHKTVENTPVAMIGMGNNGSPPFWVMAELKENGKFTFEQRLIDLPEDHPYHPEDN